MTARSTTATACTIGTAVLAACGSTGSQGGGARIDRFEPMAKLEVEHRNESYGNDSAVSTRELTFRESVGANFEGNVYHPKLLTFGGLLELGLEQREIDQRGAPIAVRSNRDNSRYDLAATMFKDHPYTVRAFAQRSQVRTRQSFFPTATAVATHEGAMAWAKEWIVPSQLEVAHHEFDGRSGDDTHEDRDTINLTGNRTSEALDVNYRLYQQNVDSSLAGSYDELQAFAGATWRFGSDYKNSLAVDGMQRDQTGDLENEYSNLGATARFWLADELESRTGVAVGNSSFGGTSTTSTDRTDAYTELEHKLYESLTTTVRGDLMHQTTGTGEIDRTGGSARMLYRKKTAIGELRGNFQLGRAQQDESGLFGARVTVTDEAHAVVLGTPIVLDNSNVETTNILVTDSTRTIVYVTPRDYVVEDFGVRSRLVIPAGSFIVAGQTILVTYTFTPPADRAFDESSYAAGIELVFSELLSLRSYWSQIDQELKSGPVDNTLEHATEVGVGARSTFGRHSISVDHLDRDSQLTPYSRSWASWDSWVPFTERLGINFGASAYQTRFKGDQRDENGVAGIADLHWLPDNQLTFDVRAELRRTDLGTETGWGAFLDSSMHYVFRKTTVDFSWIQSRERWDFSSDRDVTRILLTVTRKF